MRPSKRAPVNRGTYALRPHRNRSRTWCIGTAIFVSGSLLNFASYGFAAQSLLSCLEAVQFVTNVIFSRAILHAPVSNTQYAGTAITILGTIFTVLFSSKGETSATTEQMISYYLQWPYQLFLICVPGAGAFFLNSTHLAYLKAKELGKVGWSQA